MSQIDIIMPNYNKAPYLENSIKSIIDQNFSDWNLYIIDDYSSDDSLQILQKYEKNPKINIIKLKKNKGPSFCRNLGIRLSNSFYIAFIDSDDYWTKNKLRDQINYMKKNNFHFTYTDFIPFFENKGKKTYLKKTKIKNDFNLKSFCRNTSINTSTLIIKREILGHIKFKKLKKLEDYIFKCDILKKYKAIKLNETSAYYRILQEGRSSNKFQNIKYLWKLNKKYNNFNFYQNLLSLILVSYNSFKKYGFK